MNSYLSSDLQLSTSEHLVSMIASVAVTCVFVKLRSEIKAGRRKGKNEVNLKQEGKGERQSWRSKAIIPLLYRTVGRLCSLRNGYE
jgi:hypothetical protein